MFGRLCGGGNLSDATKDALLCMEVCVCRGGRGVASDRSGVGRVKVFKEGEQTTFAGAGPWPVGSTLATGPRGCWVVCGIGMGVVQRHSACLLLLRK